MASLQDYLEGSPLFDTKKEQEYNRLLTNIAGYQGNRAAAQALGLPDLKAEPERGIISRVLGGVGAVGKVLDLPAKGVRAMLTGGKTGGELPVLKIKRGDSILERGLKLAGAFGVDVVTDPLSYIGAPASLGRKFAASTVVEANQAKRLLGVAEDLLQQSGRNADEITSALARQSVQAKVAAEQASKGIDAAEKTAANLFDLSDEVVKKDLASQELGRIIGESLLTGGRSAVTRNLTTVLGDRALADKLFQELPDVVKGGVFVANPITGKPQFRLAGGKGRVSAAAEAANRARLAAATGFGELGYRFTDGAGLAGRYGGAWQDVNRGLKKAISDPDFILKPGLGRTNLSQFERFRVLNTEAQSLRHSIMWDARLATERPLAAKGEFAESAYPEFDDAFSEAFQLPRKPLETTSPVAKRAADEARALREEKIRLHQLAIDYNVDIGDMGIDHTPLMYDRAYWEKSIKESPRGAGTRNTDLGYNAAGPRTEWTIDPIKEPEKWKAVLKASNVSEDLPLDDAIARIGNKLVDGKVAMAPVAVNKYLRSIGELGAGEIRFVENPLIMMQRYFDSMSKKIAAQKLLNDGLKAGVLFVDPMTLTKQTRLMDTFRNGMRKIAPDIAKRVEAAVEGRRQALLVQATQGSQEVLAEAKAARDHARARYDVAKNNEAAVVKSLKEATDEVDRLRAAAGNIDPLLRQYGKEGKEELAIQLNKTQRNVKARLKRAQQSLKEASAVKRAAEKRLDRAAVKSMTAEEKASQLLFEAETLWDKIVEEGAEPALLKNYNKLEELLSSADDDVAEILAKEQLEESLLDDARAVVMAKTGNVSTARSSLASTTSELQSVRTAATSLRGRLSEQQQMVVGQFENALQRRAQIQQQLEDAVTLRNEFRPDARKLSRRIPLEAAQSMDILAAEYSTAVDSFVKAKAHYDDLVRSGLDAADAKEVMMAAKKEVTAGKKALSEAVGSWGGKGSVVAKYRKALLNAATQLEADQLTLLRIISDNDRLEKLLTQAGSTSGAQLEAAAADLHEIFYSIRNSMTEEDYTAFKDAASIFQTAPSRSRLPITTEDAKVSELGKFLNDNALETIGASVAGGSVNVPGYLSDLHTARGIREFIENTYLTNADPTAIKGFFSNIYDPLILLWKSGVTVGRGPAYVLSNLAGALYMNHLAGVTAKTHRETAKVMLAIESATKQAEKELPKAARSAIIQRADEITADKIRNMTIAGIPAVDVVGEFFTLGGREMTQTAEVMQMFAKDGIAVNPKDIHKKIPSVKARFGTEPTGKVDATFRKVVDYGLTNKMYTKFGDWSQNVETFVRISAFADGLAKYGSSTTAWDQMIGLHFDYQNLSDAEQKIRRFMPFYTWTRNNVPVQIRALFLQPGKIRKFLYAREEFKNAFGTDEESGWMNDFLPEYVAKVGGFATMFGGSSPIALSGRLPFDDIERLMTPVANRQEIAQMIGPMQIGYDLLTGINSSTGQKFNPQGEKAGGYLNLLSYIPGVGKTGRGGERRVDSKVAAAITELLPQLSMADRAISAASWATGGRLDPLTTERSKEKGLQNLLNLSGIAGAGGFTAAQVTPGAMSGELARRQEAQLAELVNRAGEMGVSLDWVRKQLRDGATPQEIAIMISSGMGTISEETMNPEGATISDRYARVMRGVKEGRIDLGY